MGCFNSKANPEESNQPSTRHGEGNLASSFPATNASQPTQDGLKSSGAQVPFQRLSSTSTQLEDCKLEVFDEAPPPYEPTSIPPGTAALLKVLREASKLTYAGHKGAWASLSDRHGQIWLDTAYTLRPITKKAILLYASVLLLVGKALRSDMTFYFTTFPNLKTEQLDDQDIKKLKALMLVFNAGTFREARELIGQNRIALADQGLDDFINNKKNFHENDTPDEKLVKLLAVTRDRMRGLWHGWNINKLTVSELWSKYMKAQKSSQKQPKLLNNTSFTYQVAVGTYKRHLTSGTVYPLTCTFLLGTRLEPAEVDAIQRCQQEGCKVVQEVRGKRSLRNRKAGSVTQELEVEGHQFCIQAIVFIDELNKQAKNAYELIDNFLQGKEDDINDVTFVSESQFLPYFLSPFYIFKTTTSHDPRVDNWPELRNKPTYNKECIVDESSIMLPSDRLIRRVVFDIWDDDDDDDSDEEQVSNDRSRAEHKINQANLIKIGTAVD